MRGYILRRLLLLIPNVFILATSIFFLMRVVPGDAAIALNLTGDGTILSWEAVEQTREDLGLNDPIWIQYGRWMGNMLKGDLGYSPLRQLNVTEIILAKAEVTFLLAFLAVIWGVLFSIPLGIIAALKRGSWIDQLIRTFSVGGLSVPNFWLGILILLMLVHWFKWSPPIFQTDFLDDPLNQMKRLIWPSVAIGISFAAIATRLIRSTMLEVLNQDYVRTARAKGLHRNRVILRHAAPNAILPVLTLSSLLFAGLLGGAVVLENLFALPGMGQQIVNAIGTRDTVLVQGIVVTLGVLVMLWNLVIDLLYVVVDPRIKLD
jgi:peptide/nickel transport system permease protein